MKDEKSDFLESLKISDSEQLTHNSLQDRQATEALCRYTNHSLDEIFYFLRNFYKENPTQEMLESPYKISSHAESYYYSLQYELVHAYSDFVNGKLSIQDLKDKFYNVCSHYKTDPLTIFKTHDSVIRVKRDPTQHDLESTVNSIEAQADICWEKIEEDRENQK